MSIASKLSKRFSRGVIVLSAVTASALAAGALSLASCATAPTPVPVRTFERAQKVDVVCLKVLTHDEFGNASIITPEPAPQSSCSAVPVDVDGTQLEHHLFALVTQTSRGEVAVVDLTGGFVVDVDSATPGLNFHVVGKNPTDIASTPDGKMTFVAAAEPNKPAIYALPSSMITGDYYNPTGDTAVRTELPSWPVCALPQAPGALAVVPTTITQTGTQAGGGTTDAGLEAGTNTGASAGANIADAGAVVSTDAGTPGDAGPGSTTPSGEPGYQLVAVLPGDARTTAKIVTMDARPFLRGGGLDSSKGTTIAPGSLAPCPITSAVELAGPTFVPKTTTAGPAWDDGIKWVEGGAPNEEADGGLPQRGSAICAAGLGTTADASIPLGTSNDGVPRGSFAALAGQVLYVSDDALPIIHVIDMRSGTAQELPPLAVTSVTEPTRVATAAGLAVSPPTRDFTRYLYAIDSKDGSLIVYDVTDPVASPRTPLTRPHPETNPFQRPDRIAFSSPVATIGFARHEWPLAFSQTAPGAAVTGLLCNPNPNAGSANNTISADGVPDAGDLGVYYRPSSTLAVGPPNTTGFTGPSPFRLRGIFAFATLSTGAMVVIDVDDWDAPCRRPDPVGVDGGPPLPSAITPAQPNPATGDLDPYHAGQSFQTGDTASNVTLESFFPVSAPNRTRSANFLRNDPSLGNFQPRIDTLPQLFSNSATVGLVRTGDKPVPLIIPTAAGTGTSLVDPNQNATPAEFNPANVRNQPTSLPNVRFSFESPEVHLDQDWTVTFEGPVPGFKGITGELQTADAYQTMTLGAPSALFCRRGVEDYRIGQQKAASVAAASTAHLDSSGKPAPLTVADRITKKTGDYVQIIDDILGNTDPYWSTGDVNGCWEGKLADDQNAGAPNSSASPKVAGDRYNACANTFGSGQDVNPVMSVQRDFPILEASQDKLVLGRFGYPDGEPPTTQSREVVTADKGNAPFLKLMRCCFHNQFQFNVRAANEWVSVGTKIGYLHHVTEGSGGACVLSCNVRDSLLNSRAPAVSSILQSDGKLIDQPGSAMSAVDITTAFDRNSALAMRNPMFSFVILNGAIAGSAADTFIDVYPDRDVQWRFTSRGQFVPLTINLAQTTSSVSPQSTKFVESLGQLAVVDGSAQGLMLIDLDLVTLAHSPYF